MCILYSVWWLGQDTECIMARSPASSHGDGGLLVTPVLGTGRWSGGCAGVWVDTKGKQYLFIYLQMYPLFMLHKTTLVDCLIRANITF